MKPIQKISNKLKFYTALTTAKAAGTSLKLFKRAGTSLPGVLALKIQKDFISNISKYCTNNIITITGTNGKTTTAGLLAHILKTADNTVLHNEKGANMLSGIASALAINYKPFTKFNYAVLESDEAYLTKLYDFINPQYLLVTNLFRDQLDRYGELDTTAKKIQEAVAKNPELTLMVNADDPMLSEIGKNNKRIFFGFENIEYTTELTDSQSPPEAVNCRCGHAMDYHKRFYAHIGHYYCPNCKKTRPMPAYNATAKIGADSSEIKLKGMTFTTGLVGLYNAYNVLAAVSTALENGITPEFIQQALDTYQSMFGRAEKFVVKNKRVLVQLIKNPTGASEVLRTINKDSASNLLIIINDNYADGRDVSWLWDTDFELLHDYPSQITVSGIRADDMAARLKYAGFPTEKINIIPQIKKALEYSIDQTEPYEKSQLVIMPTYTALLEMQHLLQGKKK